MKILWLTPIFPYPPFSGGQTRAYNLLKQLTKNNEITLFSFLRPGKIQGPVSELEKYCRKIKTFAGRKAWTPRNILLAGFSNLPFAVTHFYDDKEVVRALREELSSEKYDLVHFESFYTSPYIKYVAETPTVLGNENIEYLIYQRFVALKQFLPLKLMISYDVWKMKVFEQNMWRKTTFNLAVSRQDAEMIEKVTGQKCPVIPNGVDIKEFNKINRSTNTADGFKLLFVGDFRYFTNQDTIDYLVKTIWPIIKRKIPNAKLWLVGKNSTALVKKIKEPDILVDSGVEDIRDAYARADLLLAPLRIKSGTQIKILEAMAAGLPVVTSSMGIEGIEAKNGKEVIIANKPEEFVKQTIELLRDKKKQERLALAARKLVAEKYDWEKIGQKLNRFYQEFINGEKN